MFELNQTDGSIRYGNATYYVPSGSEPLLQDDFVVARPAIVQLKYPVKGIPRNFIVPQSAVDDLSAHRPKIVVEIIRRWGDIPKGELARIVLGANMSRNKYSVGEIDEIAELVDFDALQTKNSLFAYRPLPASEAPKGYPITFTVDE